MAPATLAPEGSASEVAVGKTGRGESCESEIARAGNIEIRDVAHGVSAVGMQGVATGGCLFVLRGGVGFGRADKYLITFFADFRRGGGRHVGTGAGAAFAGCGRRRLGAGLAVSGVGVVSQQQACGDGEESGGEGGFHGRQGSEIFGGGVFRGVEIDDLEASAAGLDAEAVVAVVGGSCELERHATPLLDLDQAGGFVFVLAGKSAAIEDGDGDGIAGIRIG